MTSNEYILKQQKLASWWNSVAQDSRFDDIIIIKGMDIMRYDSLEQMAGANRVLEELRVLAQNLTKDPPALSAGLQHDFNKPKSQKN